jgi:YYY domain-containing protein
MKDILLWWLIVQALGWAVLPIAMRLFRWLPDRGYAFSKALGLLLASYFLWVGASGGLLRNDTGGIILAIFLVAGLSTWIFLRDRRNDPDSAELIAFLRRRRTVILAIEALFLLAFLAWAMLRAFAPYKIMETGGEKFMEIAFLNAILRSEQFPPLDPWLSGFAISYYYFGYIMMALLTRLSGAVPTIGFELHDALLFALTAVGGFGVVYNLVASKGEPATGSEVSPRASLRLAPHESGSIAAGLLGALFIAVLGNLEGLLESAYARGILPESFWRWINIPGLLGSPVSGSWYPGDTSGWWWWRASRILSDIDLRGQPIAVAPISEFPAFSFILGDNHPHVLALPFVLLAIGLAFNLLLHRYYSRCSEVISAWWNPAAFALDGDWVLFLLGALILGGLAFLNTWDFPIYLGVAILAYILGEVLSSGWDAQRIFRRVTSLALGWFSLSILLYTFFYIGFRSQAAGVLPYVFPPTRLPQYLVMFGTFIYLIMVYLLVSLRRHGRSAVSAVLRTWVGVIIAGVLFFILLLLVIALSGFGRQLAQGVVENPVLQSILGQMDLAGALRTVVGYRLRDPWLFLLLSGLIALALVNLTWPFRKQASPPGTDESGPNLTRQRGVHNLTPGEIFAFLLILGGLLLTFSVEFIYLRDSFGVRMNTVFKFYYQGWVMLGCASAFGLWWLAGRTQVALHPLSRAALLSGSILLIVAGMVYPGLAIHSRAQGFRGPANLDGASEVAQSHPDDWAAIQWLQANVSGAPTILEAPGKSYNYEGRISAFTGLPALLGWAIHESQWRGNYDEQGLREPDIAVIYSTHDGRLSLELLQKWGVSYVIVGGPERNYIEQLCADPARSCSLSGALRKFDLLLKPVFNQGQVTIYQVPQINR